MNDPAVPALVQSLFARAGWQGSAADDLPAPNDPATLEVAPVNETTSARSGLAGWQIARVTAYIDTHIDTTIYSDDLAALARLSSFHFCRVFRNTFGIPPHKYIMYKRIERAKSLMLSTPAPLGQIAADCGLADQAHFNKLFRRFVGDTPGAWRRARLPVVAAE